MAEEVHRLLGNLRVVHDERVPAGHDEKVRHPLECRLIQRDRSVTLLVHQERPRTRRATAGDDADLELRRAQPADVSTRARQLTSVMRLSQNADPLGGRRLLDSLAATVTAAPPVVVDESNPAMALKEIVTLLARGRRRAVL